MTDKKIYTAPTAEVFYLETENIKATSLENLKCYSERTENPTPL